MRQQHRDNAWVSQVLLYLLSLFILNTIACSSIIISSYTAADMAWRSSGSSNAALIANLAGNGLIQSERVKSAMLRVLLPPLSFGISQSAFQNRYAALPQRCTDT